MGREGRQPRSFSDLICSHEGGGGEQDGRDDDQDVGELVVEMKMWVMKMEMDTKRLSFSRNLYE